MNEDEVFIEWIW